jgi:hypothetical protein
VRHHRFCLDHRNSSAGRDQHIDRVPDKLGSQLRQSIEMPRGKPRFNDHIQLIDKTGLR